MAADANALLTTGGSAIVGMREDINDIITQIGREETPLLSFMGTGQATNTVAHQWETYSLGTPTKIARAEGDAYAASASKRATKLTNACQIVDDTAEVSDSTEAVDVVGQMNKLDKQVLIKGIELKRDLEVTILSDQDIKTTDPRELAGIQSFAGISDYGTGGTGSSGDGTVSPVHGTSRNLSVALLNDKLQDAWATGARPSVLMMSSGQKLAFDAIIPDDQQLSVSNTAATNEGAIVVSTVSLWRSAFGDVRLVMNHLMTNNTYYLDNLILGLDERQQYRPKLCPLPGRGWRRQPLPKIRRSVWAAVEWEGTVEYPNPNAIMAIGALSDDYSS